MSGKKGSDTRLGMLAVGSGFLAESQLKRCLKEQARLKKTGVKLKIGQFLVKHDFVSTTQLVELLNSQRELRGGVS